MKKNFFAFAAVLSALSILASCEKTPNVGGNDNLKDDDKIDETLHPSLQGKEYVTLNLDEYSTKSIKNRIKASYQLDNTNVFLDVWPEGQTYIGNDAATGVNFYGEGAGWISMKVANEGWSGAGLRVATPAVIPSFADAANLADWKFHVAYKGEAGVVQLLRLLWNGKTYKFAVGEGQYNEDGVDYKAIAPVDGNFTAGKWNEYEVSLSETGLEYATATGEGTIFSFTSGSVPGTAIDIDAIFFYRK